MSGYPRTVRSLHTEAMALAGDAQVLDMHGNAAEAAPLYRRAAALEWQAVEQVRDVPNNQPTLGILEESARSLERRAHRMTAAAATRARAEEAR